VEIWVKSLQNNEPAVCFLNRSFQSKTIAFDWQTNVIDDTLFKRKVDFSTAKYSISNCRLKKEEGSTDKTYNGNLLPQDIIVLKLKPKKNYLEMFGRRIVY
jgi:Alpha galactosidase C-terminal beta sandwich domain